MTDFKKVKILGKLLFKLETRTRTGSIRKILILMFSYLIPGWFLPFLLFRQSTDPTGYEYVFLTYLFFTVILSFTFISELDNIIISKSESEIFSMLPLEESTIVNAKMYVIIRYLALLSLPLLLPGSFYYFFIVKSVPRVLLYYLSGLILSSFIVNLILLIYCAALMNFKLKRLSTYTYIFQVLLIFLLVVGYQFVSYSFTGRFSPASLSYFGVIQKNGILQYFPQAWYGLIPVSRNVTADYRLLIKATLPLILTYLSHLSLKMYLSENYGTIRERFMRSKIFYGDTQSTKDIIRGDSLWTRFIDTVYIKNPAEQSSYTWLKNFFKRDKAVKLNLLPMIMIPAGLAVFALVTNQLPPPFSNPLLGSYAAFHISIPISVLVVITTAMLGIKITSNPSASWVYEAYPIESKMRFKNGIRKFFVVYLLLPVCLLLFIIYWIAMPFYQAAVNTLFIFSVSNMFNSLSHSFSKTLPFSRENTLINSGQRIFSMVLAVVFGIPVIALQFFVYRSMLDAAVASIIVITVTYWLNYFIFVREKKIS